MSKKYEPPKNRSLIIFGVGFIVLMWLFWNPFNVSFSKETIRHIDITGSLLQILGTVLLAYELITGPLANRYLAEFKNLSSENLEKSKAELSNSEGALEKARVNLKIVERRKNLESKYQFPLNFRVSVRQIYFIGFALTLFGALLQVCVK